MGAEPQCQRFIDAAAARRIGDEKILGFMAIAEASNGRLYAPPWLGAHVLEVDPASSSTKLIAALHADPCCKYCAIAAAPNGKLYAPPWCAGRVLEVNPATGEASTIGAWIEGNDKSCAI